MPSAETCIVYCKEGEEEKDDKLLELNKIKVYLENLSLPFLGIQKSIIIPISLVVS